MFDDGTVLFFDDASVVAERLRDRAELDRIAAGARRLVQTKLSLPAMVESYERVYREAAGT